MKKVYWKILKVLAFPTRFGDGWPWAIFILASVAGLIIYWTGQDTGFW